jgi:hypothetical protein
MKERDTKPAFSKVILGWALLGATLLAFFNKWISPGLSAGLAGAGFVLYGWGCVAFTRAKGGGLGSALLRMVVGMMFTPFALLLRVEKGPKLTAAQSRQYKVLGWVLGVLMVAAGAALLAGYEVHWARVVLPEKQSLGTAQTVTADKLAPENEGRLVHVTGRLAGAEKLTDPEFGVTMEALNLRRRVWMRQWEQGGLVSKSKISREDPGGKTTTLWKSETYSYSQVWSEQVINSSSFHNAGHDNPTAIKIPKRETNATKMTLGSFVVGAELAAQLDNFQSVPLSETNLSALSPLLRAEAKLAGDEIYFGTNPQQPAIGDTKVKLEFAPAATVSVIARQSGNTLSPYAVAKAGSVGLLRLGEHSVEDMTAQFAKANAQERMTVWIAGGVITLLGLVCINVARKR